MAGVMTALEANHDIGLLRQPVDDLALAFVAPLRANHHHVRHSGPFPRPTTVPVHRRKGADSIRIKDATTPDKTTRRTTGIPQDRLGRYFKALRQLHVDS